LGYVNTIQGFPFWKIPGQGFFGQRYFRLTGIEARPGAVARVGVEDEARGAATTGEDEPAPRNSQSIGIGKLLLSSSSHPLAEAMSRPSNAAGQRALSPLDIALSARQLPGRSGNAAGRPSQRFQRVSKNPRENSLFRLNEINDL